MAEQKVKLEPAGPIVFAGPFDQKRQVKHNLTNVSAKNITTKVKCSDTACLQASPVFSMIEPTKSIPLTFQCRFADGKPNPKKQYMVGVVIADAPAGLTNEPAKIKEAWGSIKDVVTLKLQCKFQEGGAPPAAAPPAEAPPAEAPPAEAPAGEAPMADAPPADAPAGEAPAPAE